MFTPHSFRMNSAIVEHSLGLETSQDQETLGTFLSIVTFAISYLQSRTTFEDNPRNVVRYLNHDHKHRHLAST